MDAEHPHRVGRPYDRSSDDENWDLAQRDETEIQRLDRNWSSLLQELRVVQTGVQLLTGFLLTLPFQQRFEILGDHMQGVYLATVCAAVASTALLIAPVAMHRFLFRRHRLDVLVRAAHRCAYAGLLLLAIAVIGMTVIIFDAVAGFYPALIAGGCAFVVFVTFWLAWPFSMRTAKR